MTSSVWLERRFATETAGWSQTELLAAAYSCVSESVHRCGFEIAAMAGFFSEGARRGCTLVLDGYVATSAALIAETLAPGTAAAMIAAHASAEPGHAAALAHLRLDPLLDWGMRLGEGTGALLALPMLDAAAALLSMATLKEVTG